MESSNQGWMWIDLQDALTIHERQLHEHGGATGLRDRGLLESALARGRHLAAYEDPDCCALAAAFTVGIVHNHPFIDGNKRTGFVVGVLFLELNGRRFFAEEPEAAQAVIDLAAGVTDEPFYAKWLRDRSRAE
jgi:death-on-curing protein